MDIKWLYLVDVNGFLIKVNRTDIGSAITLDRNNQTRY
jgi:hypothetical protein